MVKSDPTLRTCVHSPVIPTHCFVCQQTAVFSSTTTAPVPAQAHKKVRSVTPPPQKSVSSAWFCPHSKTPTDCRVCGKKLPTNFEPPEERTFLQKHSAVISQLSGMGFTLQSIHDAIRSQDQHNSSQPALRFEAVLELVLANTSTETVASAPPETHSTQPVSQHSGPPPNLAFQAPSPATAPAPAPAPVIPVPIPNASAPPAPSEHSVQLCIVCFTHEVLLKHYTALNFY